MGGTDGYGGTLTEIYGFWSGSFAEPRITGIDGSLMTALWEFETSFATGVGGLSDVASLFNAE